MSDKSDETLKIEPRNPKNIIPEFKTQTKGFFNSIIKIDNAFLQKLVDKGGTLIYDGRDYFTLHCFESQVMFKVREYGIYIECISTYVDCRGRGSATSTMQALVETADETNTKLRLTTSNVTVDKSWYIAPPTAIAIGSERKGKIPVRKLVSFYSKFGFVQDFPTGRGCWTMEYKPRVQNGNETSN